MIDLDVVRLRYAEAGNRLGLRGAADEFAELLNLNKHCGNSLKIDAKGQVSFVSAEDDRGNESVEFSTNDEQHLIDFLLERLVRSCAVRDLINEERVREMTTDEYTSALIGKVREYQNRLNFSDKLR